MLTFYSLAGAQCAVGAQVLVIGHYCWGTGS